MYLDPNNPRLFAKEADKVPLENVTDPGVQNTTQESVLNVDDTFGIKELVKAILINGYLPEAGGFMFVRKLPDKGKYLVLEGNRRLAAIRKILAQKDKHERDYPDTIQSISQIEVMEIVDNITEEELQKNQLSPWYCSPWWNKKWSPFAQASEIFKTYLEISGQNKDTFMYNNDCGQKVASLLNTNTKEVKERLLYIDRCANSLKPMR